MLYETKFNGAFKSILRIDTERTCGELVESSRMYKIKKFVKNMHEFAVNFEYK
jgi:hypothetical protein